MTDHFLMMFDSFRDAIEKIFVSDKIKMSPVHAVDKKVFDEVITHDG